jgi:ArsR family transcriptional regulator
MEHDTGMDLKRTCRCVKAVSDPTRLKILKLLQVRTACVCELSSLLGFAQPTVSRHLHVLQDAGFVRFERRGLRRDYMLCEEDASPIAQQLLPLIRGWHEGDKEIRMLRERLEVTVAQMCAGAAPTEETTSEREVMNSGDV